MFNKYCIVQKAENTFIFHLKKKEKKKAKTGIPDYPSPGKIEIKISGYFPSPHLSFPKWKLLGIALSDFSKYVYEIDEKSIKQENLHVCWHLDVS